MESNSNNSSVAGVMASMSLSGGFKGESASVDEMKKSRRRLANMTNNNSSSSSSSSGSAIATIPNSSSSNSGVSAVVSSSSSKPRVFRKRTCEQEQSILLSYRLHGIDQEDIDYIKRVVAEFTNAGDATSNNSSSSSSKREQEDETLRRVMKKIHWTDHCATLVAAAQGNSGEASHGQCARTQAFSKLSDEEKRQTRTRLRLNASGIANAAGDTHAALSACAASPSAFSTALVAAASVTSTTSAAAAAASSAAAAAAAASSVHGFALPSIHVSNSLQHQNSLIPNISQAFCASGGGGGGAGGSVNFHGHHHGHHHHHMHDDASGGGGLNSLASTGSSSGAAREARIEQRRLLATNNDIHEVFKFSQLKVQYNKRRGKQKNIYTNSTNK